MSVSYNIVFFAAIMGILPVTWWFWIIIKENHFGKSSFNLLVEVFFWGVLTAIPASIIEMIIADTGGGSQIVTWMQKIWLFGEVPFKFTAFLSAGLIATIEELSKLIGIIIILGKRNFKNVNEGLIFGLVVGLAFAVTENGVYFSTAVQSREVIDFGSVIVLRFVLSTSAHVIYSGIAGLFFAKAIAAKGVQKAQFFLLSICFPILTHAIFNFLLGGPRGINSAILAIIMSIGLLMLWNEYQENMGKHAFKNKKKIKKNAKK
ncbi:PrsW family intramembrane metalloprotease [bacterium]|mgnify:CR=1 FL=1|jgi:RsiW-degrading membrane proteinase PrsW (M82 family)|nr:PrsW family intramembrane metalloprotease [bacterium]MBT4251615.1 PrsW family intramembrane metalloprotease [bacterium]MBT4597664.1 PrsW family intramembrane metalloprotease [bacterium]MBT6753677.1 PrsW family intramembrane metalloprotease [bacterium]MBT7037814.1 PrsW family intramembrane metalloprotease [bacterium]